MENQVEASDPLAMPADWLQLAAAAFKDVGFKESPWHATYRAGWAECAARAGVRLQGCDRVLRAVLEVRDARIAALRKENALLKAQLEEFLERLTPGIK